MAVPSRPVNAQGAAQSAARPDPRRASRSGPPARRARVGRQPSRNTTSAWSTASAATGARAYADGSARRPRTRSRSPTGVLDVQPVRGSAQSRHPAPPLPAADASQQLEQRPAGPAASSARRAATTRSRHAAVHALLFVGSTINEKTISTRVVLRHGGSSETPSRSQPGEAAARFAIAGGGHLAQVVVATLLGQKGDQLDAGVPVASRGGEP
jgi:hypothetical protein